MNINIEENKNTFIDLIMSVLPTSEAHILIDKLANSDFFYAPASTRFHLCEPGGLCQHSLNVYYAAMLIDSVFKTNAPKRSIVLCSLLHDLCKVNVYAIEQKNKKIYDPETLKTYPDYKIKHDRKGDFVWETIDTYVYADEWPFGHGSKSAYLASKYISITDDEAMAIRYHMGAYEEGDIKNCSKVFSTNKLALLIHMADQYATNIMEVENEG